jgi:hypothetical protein
VIKIFDENSSGEQSDALYIEYKNMEVKYYIVISE